MRVGLRTLTSDTVHWLAEALTVGTLSRAALARELCAREDWRNARGELCAPSARKALPRLAQQLGQRLPAPRNAPPPRRAPSPEQAPDTVFAGSIGRLGPLCLQRIETARERRTWRAMLEAHHPLGVGLAPGCRVSYLLRSPRRGVLGGLSFVAAPMRLAPRDRYIRWSWRARHAHLGHVVHNDRFLLLPGVQVRNLASHVLARAARQLRADWQAAAGVRPLLLETCVGAAYRGTSYRAAGWRLLEERTAGQPPGPRRGPEESKAVWLRPLRSGAVALLAREPPRPLGEGPPWEPRPGEHWSVREFGRADHYDQRVRERLLIMGKAWDRAPDCELPGMFPRRAQRKAAYRLLANPRVTMDDILHPHREAVVERCALETTVLLVQDTTTLNYSGLGNCTRGLGPLGGKSKGKDGLLVHAGLALADGGRALGVFWLRPWARLKEVEALAGGKEKESVRWLEGFEQALELGRACPHTRVITVCDREGDIFSLFRRQAERPAAGLLVRANRARQRRVQLAQEVQPLWTHLRGLQPVVSDRIVSIGARGGKHARKRRKARTEVRVAPVELRAPKGRGAPVAAQAVLVSEPQPPKGRKALNWLLLSSDGEATARDALRTVARYERRWLIEEYFRVLKCGTKLLDRRLREAASIENCLVFEAVNAWKVFDITRLARERPQAPAEESFSAIEMRVLNTLLNVERILPAGLCNQPPPSDIQTTVVNLARVAGFRPTKRQMLPGDTVVWKAWQIIKPMIRWEEARIAAENAANAESTVS